MKIKGLVSVAKSEKAHAAKTGESASYHHGNLRAALIEAARGILVTEGVGALSLRAVARRAGVSQTAPYRHFKDKEALLAELAAEGFRGLTARMLGEAAGATGAGARRQALGRGYVLFAVENPAFLRLMFGSEIPQKSAHPGLCADADAAFAVLADATDAARAESGSTTDRRIAALAAWSMVHGLANLLIDGQVGERVLEGEAPDIGRLTDLVTATMR
jgi:AcrR family transcriptional regulator